MPPAGRDTEHGSAALSPTSSVRLLLLLLLGAPGCFFAYEICPEPKTDALPERLSETGLFDDVDNEVLGPGVRAYAPQFALETDGATKRRWIQLPDGAQIDTSDPDEWSFPAGTQLWKEFSRDGVRVETRLLARVGPLDDEYGGWVAVAYVWDGNDAIATPAGLDDAKGTPHDVPSASLCMGCHGGRAARVLGFSATQLAYDAPPDLVDLADLIAEGTLSSAPNVSLPGDDLDRRALGYLHANCAHCHNDARPPAPLGYRCYDPQKPFDFSLPSTLTDIADAPVLSEPTRVLLERERVEREAPLILLMERGRMPAAGSEEVDEEGLALLREWLERV